MDSSTSTSTFIGLPTTIHSSCCFFAGSFAGLVACALSNFVCFAYFEFAVVVSDEH